MVRIAKKTIELTIQVEPKSKAMCTTPLVSSSMKPAPRKNIWPLGRRCRTGAKAKRIDQREHRHDARSRAGSARESIGSRR